MSVESPVFMVSEDATSPPMPFEAMAALQKVRAQAWIAAQLDAEGVPQDSPLRAKASRLIAEFADQVAARDLERIRTESARKQWNARKRKPKH